MHACGHDGHMASLLAATRVFVGMKAQLHGTVKLIFQPAEEGEKRGGGQGRGGEEAGERVRRRWYCFRCWMK